MAESYRGLAHFPAADLAGRTAQGDSGHQRPSPGRKDHNQHQHRNRARPERDAGTVDRRRSAPSQHSQDPGHGPKTGLSNVFTGNATLQQAVITFATFCPHCSCFTAGTPPPNPAELLASSNMKDVLAELREQYDHIVVDTPPTLSVTDAVVMSTRADAVVLVIRSGQTTKQALASRPRPPDAGERQGRRSVVERGGSQFSRLLLLLRIPGKIRPSLLSGR